MKAKRITYVPGTASLVSLADGTRLLFEIVPGMLRVRTQGRFSARGKDIWHYRFPFALRERYPAAEEALDIALDSIENCATLEDVEHRLESHAAPRLAVLAVEGAITVDVGDVAPVVPPPQFGQFESGSTRARWLTILLGIIVAVDLIAVVSGLAEYMLLDRMLRGAFVSNAEVAANDTRQAFVALAQTGLFLATAIVFCMWLHRAYRNLPTIGVAEVRFTPAWVVGYFFIPIVNLFRPYQAVKEIYIKSDCAYEPAVAESAPIVGSWWAAWLFYNWFSWRALRISLTAGDNIGDLAAGTVLYVVSDAINILAAILAIAVVRGINWRQEENYRGILAGSA